MKYIDNPELREWVKDSLKMTIFQKAHALAIQTGCQILVKLHDDTDATQQQQYYATSRLKKVYRQKGLREQPGEKCVSGVTGFPLVDQGIQMEQEHRQTDTSLNSAPADRGQEASPENGVTSRGSGPDERLDSASLTEGPVPMQLSVSSDSFRVEDSGESSEQTDLKPNKESLDISTIDEPVRIKVEQIDDDDDDPGGGGGDGTNMPSDTAMYQEQINYDTSTSVQTSMPVASTTTPHKATAQLLQASALFQQQQQEQHHHIPPSPATIVQHHQEQYQQVPMSPKPYQCAMCGKAFRSVQVLQKHTQTFHMPRTQHHIVAMGARNRGRGRGKQTWQRLTTQHQQTNPQQTNSFQCVMCSITFPDAEILQDHMTRTHMGGATPIPQGSHGAPPDFNDPGDVSFSVPDDPNFSAPGPSHQTTSSFPIPHTQSSPGDAVPALRGTPYSQPSSSAAPSFSRSAPASMASKAGTSDGSSFPRILTGRTMPPPKTRFLSSKPNIPDNDTQDEDHPSGISIGALAMRRHRAKIKANPELDAEKKEKERIRSQKRRAEAAVSLQETTRIAAKGRMRKKRMLDKEKKALEDERRRACNLPPVASVPLTRAEKEQKDTIREYNRIKKAESRKRQQQN